MMDVTVLTFLAAAVRLNRADAAIPLMQVVDADTLEVFLPETATSPRIAAIQEDLKALLGVARVSVWLVQGMLAHRVIGQWRAE